LDSLSYAVVRLDDGKLAKELIDAWVEDHGDPVELPAHWRDDVMKGLLDYVILIEKPFSEQIIAEKMAAEPCVRFFAKPQIETSIYNLNKVNLALILNQLRSEALLKTSRAKEFRPAQCSKDCQQGSGVGGRRFVGIRTAVRDGPTDFRSAERARVVDVWHVLRCRLHRQFIYPGAG